MDHLYNLGGAVQREKARARIVMSDLFDNSSKSVSQASQQYYCLKGFIWYAENLQSEMSSRDKQRKASSVTWDVLALVGLPTLYLATPRRRSGDCSWISTGSTVQHPSNYHITSRGAESSKDFSRRTLNFVIVWRGCRI